MTSLLSSLLKPTPFFPPYTGPYRVGTIDVEIPISHLESPSPAPDANITTTAFRIFYPCETPAKPPQPVYWLPEPQREYLKAYAGFLGAGPWISEIFSFFPGLIRRTTIPALRNARILPATTENKRWPVMVFSHGLAGSRNAYSHILGSVASHGVVVVTPDHRDGSAPISFMRGADGVSVQAVDYRPISHTISEEVQLARDEQLKIRLWELGLVHEALLKIDCGKELLDLAADESSKAAGEEANLATFASSLDVHRPGKICWSGHSFGAATVYQFIKSVYYRPSPSTPATYKPLYTPSESSSIVRQITPSSSTFLLDLWTLSLICPSTTWLWERPFPCYERNGPGGSKILAVLSEAFFKWKANLEYAKRAISEDPTQEHSSPSTTRSPPHIFYPVASAHLSQSDFGILFPWATKKAFKADEPARALRLNVRAILEMMRENGLEVGNTSDIDMDIETHGRNAKDLNGVQSNGYINKVDAGHGRSLRQDTKILARDGGVRGWVSVNVDEEEISGEATNNSTVEEADPIDAVVEGEFMKDPKREAAV